MRARLVAAVAVLGLVAAGCSPGRPESCDAGPYVQEDPIATSAGPIASIQAGSSATDRGRMLYVRVTFAGPASPHVLFGDADSDRLTGMWTYQSPVSASGWDVFVDEGGALHRHFGWPNEWRWRPADASGYGRGGGSNFVDYCIPLQSTDPTAPVRLSVMRDDDAWLPSAFRPGAVFPPQPGSGRLEPPDRMSALAINYSATPWLVERCDDASPACEVDHYRRFRDVVLASGLEEPTHPSHDGARSLIGALRTSAPSTTVWGYVSMIGGPARPDGMRDRVYSVGDAIERARWWQAIGATGIFLDEADLCRPVWQDCPVGPDGSEADLSRARQAAIVAGIHALGLPVFANAFAVHDVLAFQDGLPSPLSGPVPGRASDVFLLENPTVSAGRLVDGLDAHASSARFASASELAAAAGVRLAAVDTLEGPVGPAAWSDARFVTALERASEAGVSMYAYTNHTYSSLAEHATNLAVWRRPG